MSESTPSAYKTLVWLLAILLIGVVALYNWHNENQSKGLADKDAEIAASAERLAEKEQQVGQARDVEQGLRAEIESLNAGHDAETQELKAELDAAALKNKALQGDMEELKAQHAQTLAAEQEKASQEYAELQGRHEDAQRQIAALGAEVERQKQSMADAAAAQEVQMAQLESELKEKVAFYRTALKGSDPERAAQLVGLELQVKADEQALEESRQAVQAMQEKENDLTQELAGATRTIAERDQALTDALQQLEQMQAQLARSQSNLSTLQQKHDVAVARATEDLAAVQQRLQASEADHVKTKDDAAAAMQEAQGRISDIDQKHKATTAELLALQQKHEAKVSELSGAHDATKRTLANVQTELGSAKDAAYKSRQAHAQQIEESQATIAELEQSLAQTKQKAAQDLATRKREGEEAVAYVRGVYTEFSKLGGRHTDRGMLLSLAEEELQFPVSKADLPEGELPSLDWIAELLVKHPKLTVRIEGHTDSKGREETNLELSRQRADAVKQALVERGVTGERMVTEGIGAERPIADNASSAGRRQNRRVEIYVLEN